MYNNSIIKKSGQLWELCFLTILGAFGSFSLFYGIKTIDIKPDSYTIFFMLSGFIAILISFIFGIVSIRCPKCKSQWFWQGMSKHSVNGWFV
ncbi:MAG: hypothetical protein ABIJ12_05520 [bacterium]